MIEWYAVAWFVASGWGLWFGLNAKQKWQRIAGHTIFFVLAVGMFNHWLPGIHNPRIYDKVLLSPDAVPFSLYLNLDKTWIGLLVYFLVLRTASETETETVADAVAVSDAAAAAMALGGLVVLMLPLALLSHYVHFDPKFPDETWIWAANNLLLVCMAEECFFRGYIQQALASRGKWFAVLAGAILFGLQHWQGGPLYIGFATIAGIAYGLVYWRSRKIAFPILIHFLFNLIHFLFFTYPALAK